MSNFMHRAIGAASLSMLLAAAPAQAGFINTFTGPWAPTAANGFTNFVQGTMSTFSTSVSADGLTLTSLIAKNGAPTTSFWLENYSFLTTPLLPTGPVSYLYAIQVFSTTTSGLVDMFDDFGNSGTYASGTIISGSRSINYTGGYFGYFGVNINDSANNASATVTLTNLSAPVSAPGTIALAALGIATLVVTRRRQG